MDAMPKKYMALVLAGFLCQTSPVMANGLDAISNTLENLADVARSANRAADAIRDAQNGRRYYDGDYDYDYNYDHDESSYANELAKRYGVKKSRIKAWRRDGHDWDEIERRCDVHYRERSHHWKRHHHDHDD